MWHRRGGEPAAARFDRVGCRRTENRKSIAVLTTSTLIACANSGVGGCDLYLRPSR